MAIESVQLYSSAVSQAQSLAESQQATEDDKKASVKNSTVASGVDTYTQSAAPESAGIYTLNNDGSVSFAAPTAETQQSSSSTDDTEDELEELEEKLEELQEELEETDDEQEKERIQAEINSVNEQIQLIEAQQASAQSDD